MDLPRLDEKMQEYLSSFGCQSGRYYRQSVVGWLFRIEDSILQWGASIIPIIILAFAVPPGYRRIVPRESQQRLKAEKLVRMRLTYPRSDL
jgi:hypothetical protein